MKKLVMFAAAIEIPTGLILIFVPSIFMRLLFGSDMSYPNQALGPLAGIALLTLAIACWPSRDAAAPAVSAVRALFAFSLLCAAYLTYISVSGGDTGILLWPAAAGHSVIALLLLWRWFTSSAIDQKR